MRRNMTKLMLAIASKRQKGEDGAARSRGLKPLLRKLILLDFSDICSMNILLFTNILKLIKELELWVF